MKLGPLGTAAILGLLAILSIASPARAQVVLFDDFDGEVIDPRWRLSRPGDWEYNVSGGMLNVTNLFYPSHPKSPENHATMDTLFTSTPLTDFRIDARMGWDEGPGPRSLWLHAKGGPNGNLIVASFGFTLGEGFGIGPIFSAGAGLGRNAPGSAEGMFTFTIARTGSRLEFYLNETFFFATTDMFGRSLTALQFDFSGPYPAPVAAYHIDSVTVIPGPSTVTLVVAMVPALFRRRR